MRGQRGHCGGLGEGDSGPVGMWGQGQCPRGDREGLGCSLSPCSAPLPGDAGAAGGGRHWKAPSVVLGQSCSPLSAALSGGRWAGSIGTTSLKS